MNINERLRALTLNQSDIRLAFIEMTTTTTATKTISNFVPDFNKLYAALDTTIFVMLSLISSLFELTFLLKINSLQLARLIFDRWLFVPVLDTKDSKHWFQFQ